ncbi:protein of unknown function [Amycolatopsis marina]|uniref:DUF397 domain-containing protein n=1 Tax=Amycolatopsis marina TaxID=490629 RepID=A0A1I0VQU2_9PSEU|nr:DUF397 domain-containing protein [Amycolatopsis marina]SFA78779.1 protein of unknown function [Amycolatopsis marina]
MPVSQSIRWQKSSYSDTGENCVEIGFAPRARAIRDTKLGEASPILHVSDRAFTEFVRHLVG